MDIKQSKYRWTVFFTMIAMFFFVMIQRTAPGVITDQLMDTFRISASTIGLTTGIQFLAYAGLQIPLGLLADKFGPSYFLIIGTLLNGLGTLLFSVTPDELLYFISRVLVGTGDAMIFINIVLVMSKWFTAKKFSGLMGWIGMSGNLGSIFASVPLAYWIGLQGWRFPFFSLSICLLAISFISFIVLRKGARLIQSSARTERKPGSSRTKTDKSMLAILGGVCRKKQAWAVFFCHFAVAGTYISFIGSWAVPYGINVYGLTRTASSQLVMAGLLSSIVGAPLIGILSGHFKQTRTLYILIQALTFASWLSFFLLAGKPPLAVLVLLYILIGFGFGASMLTFSIIRESFQSGEIGVVSGFANTGGYLSALLLPILFGLVLEMFHSGTLPAAGYHYGFLIPSLFSFCGLAGSLLLKKRQKPGESSSSLAAGEK